MIDRGVRGSFNRSEFNFRGHERKPALVEQIEFLFEFFDCRDQKALVDAAPFRDLDEIDTMGRRGRHSSR